MDHSEFEANLGLTKTKDHMVFTVVFSSLTIYYSLNINVKKKLYLSSKSSPNRHQKNTQTGHGGIPMIPAMGRQKQENQKFKVRYPQL